MSLHRRAAKRDANEKAIVQALEAVGVVVQRLSQKGAPDLLAWHPADGFRLLEVKAVKNGRVTPAQKLHLMPRTTVRTPAEALAIYGIGESLRKPKGA